MTSSESHIDASQRPGCKNSSKMKELKRNKERYRFQKKLGSICFFFVCVCKNNQ